MQETGTAQPLDSLFHVQGPLQNWPHDTSHRDAEALVLIRVEVHASTRPVVVAVPASKNSQSRSFATADNAAARPADFCAAPSNFGAIAPYRLEIVGAEHQYHGASGELTSPEPPYREPPRAQSREPRAI
jgi:hypothetical protein